MKGGIIALIVVVVIILVIGGFFLFQREGDINENNQDSGMENQNVGTQPQTRNIEIKNFAFQTSELKINVGDTVAWINKDFAKHTVTSDSGNELGSSLLSKEQSYSHIFTEKGIFEYHCTPHPYMKGKIIVE